MSVVSVKRHQGMSAAVGHRALLLCAAALLCACYVDRDPAQHIDAPGGWYEGSFPAHQAADRTVGGLYCDRACPFAAPPLEPCCTSAADVNGNRAHAVGACGVDFTGRAPGQAGQCWERDQPGVTDDDCPGASPEMAVTSEPGCCTRSGLCGTSNVGDAIGCHANPGITTRCDEGVDKTRECDLTGTFAVRNEVEVYWGGRTGGIAELTDDGRGYIIIDLLIRIDNPTADGLSFDAVAHPCAVRLPPFYSSTLCETYDAQFPDSIWDSGGVQPIITRAHAGCNNPGCLMEIEPGVGLIGIDMDNPEALWPTPSETPTHSCAAGNGPECFPDVDLDGHPAATLTIRTDGVVPTKAGSGCSAGFNRRAVPLSEDVAAILDPFSGNNVRRGDRLFLGTRTKLGGTIRLPEDCTGAVGVGLAEFVQSRAWGCLIKEGTGTLMGAAGPNDLCRAAEGGFIDENLPIYQILLEGERPDPERLVPDHPSTGAVTRLVRLGPPDMQVTCGEVRNAAYP